MNKPAALALAAAVLAPAPALAQESPSPSPATAPAADCRNAVEPVSGPVTAWGLDGKGGVTVTVTGSPGETVVVHGYVRPSTERRELGRATTDENGKAPVFLPIQGSARLRALGGCPLDAPDQVIQVKVRFGPLNAHRHAPRDYSFSAFYAGPDGKLGNLYRVLADGRQILTAQTRMSGELATIRRVFTGSGRFGFVLRTGNDINALGGSTNIRDTVIH